MACLDLEGEEFSPIQTTSKTRNAVLWYSGGVKCSPNPRTPKNSSTPASPKTSVCASDLTNSDSEVEVIQVKNKRRKQRESAEFDSSKGRSSSYPKALISEAVAESAYTARRTSSITESADVKRQRSYLTGTSPKLRDDAVCERGGEERRPSRQRTLNNEVILKSPHVSRLKSDTATTYEDKDNLYCQETSPLPRNLIKFERKTQGKSLSPPRTSENGVLPKSPFTSSRTSGRTTTPPKQEDDCSTDERTSSHPGPFERASNSKSPKQMLPDGSVLERVLRDGRGIGRRTWPLRRQSLPGMVCRDSASPTDEDDRELEMAQATTASYPTLTPTAANRLVRSSGTGGQAVNGLTLTHHKRRSREERTRRRRAALEDLPPAGSEIWGLGTDVNQEADISCEREDLSEIQTLYLPDTDEVSRPFIVKGRSRSMEEQETEAIQIAIACLENRAKPRIAKVIPTNEDNAENDQAVAMDPPYPLYDRPCIHEIFDSRKPDCGSLGRRTSARGVMAKILQFERRTKSADEHIAGSQGGKDEQVVEKTEEEFRKRIRENRERHFARRWGNLGLAFREGHEGMVNEPTEKRHHESLGMIPAGSMICNTDWESARSSLDHLPQDDGKYEARVYGSIPYQGSSPVSSKGRSSSCPGSRQRSPLDSFSPLRRPSNTSNPAAIGTGASSRRKKTAGAPFARISADQREREEDLKPKNLLTYRNSLPWSSCTKGTSPDIGSLVPPERDIANRSYPVNSDIVPDDVDYHEVCLLDVEGRNASHSSSANDFQGQSIRKSMSATTSPQSGSEVRLIRSDQWIPRKSRSPQLKFRGEKLFSDSEEEYDEDFQWDHSGDIGIDDVEVDTAQANADKWRSLSCPGDGRPFSDRDQYPRRSPPWNDAEPEAFSPGGIIHERNDNPAPPVPGQGIRFGVRPDKTTGPLVRGNSKPCAIPPSSVSPNQKKGRYRRRALHDPDEQERLWRIDSLSSCADSHDASNMSAVRIAPSDADVAYVFDDVRTPSFVSGSQESYLFENTLPGEEIFRGAPSGKTASPGYPGRGDNSSAQHASSGRRLPNPRLTSGRLEKSWTRSPLLRPGSDPGKTRAPRTHFFHYAHSASEAPLPGQGLLGAPSPLQQASVCGSPNLPGRSRNVCPMSPMNYPRQDCAFVSPRSRSWMAGLPREVGFIPPYEGERLGARSLRAEDRFEGRLLFPTIPAQLIRVAGDCGEASTFLATLDWNHPTSKLFYPICAEGLDSSVVPLTEGILQVWRCLTCAFLLFLLVLLSSDRFYPEWYLPYCDCQEFARYFYGSTDIFDLLPSLSDSYLENEL